MSAQEKRLAELGGLHPETLAGMVVATQELYAEAKAELAKLRAVLDQAERVLGKVRRRTHDEWCDLDQREVCDCGHEGANAAIDECLTALRKLKGDRG